jgi:hypothetical protein
MTALKSQAHELVKQHIEYDVNGRTEYIYTARNEARNGAPCSVVRYAYVGLSTQVTYMKEYNGNWDTSWELF